MIIKFLLFISIYFVSFQPHNPPYAASLIFEMYKINNEFYLELFYKNTTDTNLVAMNIPKCGTKCTLQQFSRIYNDILPTNDFETECRTSIMSMTYTDVDFSQYLNGLISLLIFSVLIALIGVFSCRYCERESSRWRYHRI